MIITGIANRDFSSQTNNVIRFESQQKKLSIFYKSISKALQDFMDRI